MPVASESSVPSKATSSLFRFVARQPILTATERILGYELLFRDGIWNEFSSTGADKASHSTLDTSLLMGLEVVCNGHDAFINCTRQVLLEETILLLHPDRVVVEVLETIAPSREVIEKCRKLKQRGYRIALDDFAYDDPRECMVELADVIKVDVKATSIAEASEMVNRYHRLPCKMLAEKVETREEFDELKQAGYTLFQGYFFQRPQLLQVRDIPSNKLNYLLLLRAVSHTEIDDKEVEDILKREASLCYRLLRYLNSPVFGLTSEIHSVRHALSMLGETEIRRWIRLVSIVSAGRNKSTELVNSALVRARFCELLAKGAANVEEDLFLLGLLSLMDAILEISMSTILEQIPVSQEAKSALQGQPGRLSPIFQLMVAQEKGDWTEIRQLAAQTKIPEDQIANARWEAMQWARQISSEE